MSAPAPVLSLWTIYHHATDVVTPYCVREWRISAGEVVAAGPAVGAWSLAEAQELVPGGLVRLPRNPGDDPVIVESWL